MVLNKKRGDLYCKEEVFFMIEIVRHWNRGGGYPILGDIQGQARPGSEQPDLAVGVPVHCRGVRLDDL